MNGLSKDRGNVLKLVTVGDSNVGKTSLLISYTLNQFLCDYTPTVFDTYSVSLAVNTYNNYILTLVDTPGQDDYMNLRSLSYPNTDIFLICFSIDNPDSLVNAEQVWIPEIKRSRYIFGTSACFLLVGTKSDLRGDLEHRGDLIPYRKGTRVAKRTGGLGYIECSALTQENLTEVFSTAIVSTLKSWDNQTVTKKPKCGRLSRLVSKCFPVKL